MTVNSEELFDYSLTKVPGGVHSPVRSFKDLHTTPRFITKGDGAYIWDIDNRKYIDFCMSFGPLILGHQNQKVKSALNEGLNHGWSYGACEPYSVELVKLLTRKLKFIDQVRFVNSGTEAVMTALRLARGYTKKDKIIKFNGCYHGHVDSMLIKAGSGLAGKSETSSRGIPQSIANDTIVVELNDKESVEKAFSKYKDEIACVIIEPLPANNGLLIQDKEFLQFLRTITKENHSLLIFDEVISGFRVSFGGMAEVTEINPDIVTYGKIIGGGLPVGALGGREEIMSHLAPTGGVYQAGTLSANPLAMIAGKTTLEALTPDAYMKLNQYTSQICKIFSDFFEKSEQFNHMQIYHYQSLFWISPKTDAIRSLNQIPQDLNASFYELFKFLLNKKIYLAPNAYEVGFVSLCHDEKLQKDLSERLCN